MNYKKDFPIFKKYQNLIYLDSAATSQKPTAVIKAVSDFYTKANSNIHRGSYPLSDTATKIYEAARKKVADFIHASSPEEIIFTSNASEAINFAATGYAQKFLRRGDIIVTTIAEHHSNFVPWLRLKEKGINLVVLPLNNNYQMDFQKILVDNIPKKKIKLIAINHASNVLGAINPVAEITNFLKENNIQAKILVDGAQMIPHSIVNVKQLDCDFYAFSSHKMLGPSGVGVLWAKEELLKAMDPIFTGSHMISEVNTNRAVWADIPDKFEVGTGSLEAVAGLGSAIDYLNRNGMKNVENYERQLVEYALEVLPGIKNIKIYGSLNPENRLGVFSFSLKGIHPHDIGEILGRDNICIRTGHHCAQPLMKALKVPATARASLYLYNTKEDIDRLAEGLNKVKKIFKNG